MTLALRTPTGLVTTAASLTVTETAASPQTGDVRYAFMYCSSGATCTFPTGWTVLTNGQVGTSGSLVGIASRAWASGVGSQNITLSSSAAYVALLVAVGGVDQALTPQFTTAGSATAGTTLTATGLTPAAADSLILGYFCQQLAAGATTATLSTPTGMASEFALFPGASAATRVGLLAGLENTTGAATGNYVSTANTSGAWTASVLAIPGLATTHPGNFFPFLGL